MKFPQVIRKGLMNSEKDRDAESSSITVTD